MNDLDNREHLGTDIAFLYDFDMGAAGEGRMVKGGECLGQDLIHALTTPKGSLKWHPDYGVDVWKYLKMANTFLNRSQLKKEIVSTVEADPRVELGSVSVQFVEWDLNRIRIKVICAPIGEAHPLNLVLDYGMYDAKGEVVKN